MTTRTAYVLSVSTIGHIRLNKKITHMVKCNSVFIFQFVSKSHMIASLKTLGSRIADGAFTRESDSG